ncbi:MAG: DUF4159 domain-containing protein [Phycisphaerales bacterium]|nr:DUF4159 domain-containing protein [Phycisphaerales bacterium]
MRLCRITFAIVLIGSVCSHAANPRQVELMLDKGVEYLYSRQKEDNWEQSAFRQQSGDPSVTTQWGGLTSLAVYALLSAGQSPQNPRLAPSIAFLKQARIEGIYALGLRAQVWNLLPPNPDIRQAAFGDGRLIFASTKKKDGSRGFYDYLPNPGSRYDHSASQYGVLGMWAAAQAGYEVPLEYWRTVDAGWKADQHESGGWAYAAGPPFSADSCTQTMTAAGVATLFVTQDYLSAARGAQCQGNVSNDAIDRGLAWMVDHFKLPDDDPSGIPWPYLLYGVERIGAASGYKYFGDLDWFKIGSDYLLERQRADGSWINQFDPLVETSFCILFLSRGRAPVAINKLIYQLSDEGHPREAHWNQRPRDVANLTRWIGRQIERPLNWQIVNLNVSPQDLHDAPILYLSGNQKLDFSPDDLRTLKTYLQTGGLILANADCGDARFADSFRRLGQTLFPGYEFRELPPDHPIYRAQFHRDRWKNKPSVLALSDGKRELMILIPAADPARYWQTQSVGGHEELWQLMANVYLYSVHHRIPSSKG